MEKISRTEQIKSWVAKQLDVPETTLQWSPLSGDASFRQYFRASADNTSYIVALAPPETEKNHEFVDIAKRLREAGVKAPEVLAVDYDCGYILQNDLGDQTLMPVLDESSVDGWYRKAFAQLLQMAKVQTEGMLPYDRAALLLELNYCVEWFVEAMLAYQLTDAEKNMIEQSFDFLLEGALAQPAIFVHRDYHCRNIMVVNSELATIDFQDALYGPFTYDLVSLLRDCYVVWPKNQVQHWVEDYRKMAIEAGVLSDVSQEEFLRWFDLMGLQRHIKVLGIFARLSIRDGKNGYLNDLPTVVTYVRQVAADYPEMKAFLNWFDDKLMPLIRQKQWGAAL